MKKDKPRHDKRHGALLPRVVLAVIGLTFFCYTEGWGADWKLFTEVKSGPFYYDTENITWSSANTVKVWTKALYNEESVSDIVAEYGAKFKGVSYSISLEELNCEGKKVRFLVERYYSKEGKSLLSFEDEKSQWRNIVPESFAEALYQEICKQK